MISTKLRALYETERDSAWAVARDKIAGPEPDPRIFRTKTMGKYPPWMLAAVTFLAIVVLIAGFLPSAFRLHEAGSDSFCEILINKDTDRCTQVGASTVLLAEIGQVIFVLSLAVLATSKVQQRIFWSGAVLSTFIALVGNAYIAEPWNHGGYLFKYLETFAPPLLVISVGYALKELFLYSVQERYRIDREFKEAVAARLLRYKSPEEDPGWNRAYSMALRDAIRRANSKFKPELLALTKDDWQHMIKTEMLASQWTVDPTQLTAFELEEKKKQEQLEAEKKRRAEELEREHQRTLLEIARLQEELRRNSPSEHPEILEQLARLSSTNGNAPVPEIPVHGDAEVWQNSAEPIQWSAKSSLSGYLIGEDFPDEATARKKLKDYNYRYTRRQNMKASQ